MNHLLVYLLLTNLAIFSFWFCVGRQQKKLYARLIEEMRANPRYDLEQIGTLSEKRSYSYDISMYDGLERRIILRGLPPLPWVSNKVLDLGRRFRFWGLLNCAIGFGAISLFLAFAELSVPLRLFCALCWLYFLVEHWKQNPRWPKYLRKAQ